MKVPTLKNAEFYSSKIKWVYSMQMPCKLFNSKLVMF